MGGLRDLDPPEAAYIDKNNIKVLTVADLTRDPGSASRLVAGKGFHNVYVHIDLDVLDSGKCPWGLCLMPDGIDTDVLLALLRDLEAHTNIAGASIVELRPADGMDAAPLHELVSVLDGLWQGGG